MNRSLRIRRHKRIRKHLFGTSSCPRLSVFRSSRHIYAQIIDDSKMKTVISAADLNQTGNKKERAYKTGKRMAERALKEKIESVVFDRGGFLYHGRIEELARGAREGGLKF